MGARPQFPRIRSNPSIATAFLAVSPMRPQHWPAAPRKPPSELLPELQQTNNFRFGNHVGLVVDSKEGPHIAEKEQTCVTWNDRMLASCFGPVGGTPLGFIVGWLEGSTDGSCVGSVVA